VPIPAYGAEDVVVAPAGRDEGAVFTGTADGSIWRIRHDASRIDLVGRTGGRPLGLEYAEGRLLVCDARVGLLWLDPTTGGIESITDSVQGRPMRFCNNAAITEDGTIWFTDSSLHFDIDHWRTDFIQHTRTGRFLRVPPGGEPEVLIEGLSFANGVALSAAGEFFAVAETRTRRVVRWWRDGHQDLLVDDLPGYPDNIARGSDGLIWVTVAAPVEAAAELVDKAPPWVRRAASRIPEVLQPPARRSARVQAYDDLGALVHDLDLPAEAYHMVTGVREHAGRVWLGSLEEPAVAYVDLYGGV
jgi:sugar lactone lactonase YvrE